MKKLLNFKFFISIGLIVTILMSCFQMDIMAATSFKTNMSGNYRKLKTPVTVAANTESGVKVTWDCIWFGNYNNEPVKWRVLSIKNNRALVLSDAILSKHYYYKGIFNDAMLRYEGLATLLWGNSDIRSYLNVMFNNMFPISEDAGAVIGSEIKTPYYNQDTGERGKDVTSENLFLLSEDDMNNPAYGFSDTCPEARRSKYTINTAVETNYDYRKVDQSNTYFLRGDGVKSSGTYGNYPWGNYLTNVPISSINEKGEITKSNGLHYFGVRVAMYVDLSKADYFYAGTVSSNGTVNEIKPVFKVKQNENHTVYYKKTSKNTVEFYGCETNKTKITIPNKIKLGNQEYKVTSIAPNVFKNNKKIKKVTIGKNVKKIGKKAFYGCKKLKTIIIQTKKLKASNVGKKAFKGIKSKAKITIPKGKKKSYTKILRGKGISKKATIKATYKYSR